MRDRREAAIAYARRVLAASQGEPVEKTIWGSPAGKKRIAQRLVAMLPAHKTYVEPFASRPTFEEEQGEEAERRPWWGWTRPVAEPALDEPSRASSQVSSSPTSPLQTFRQSLRWQRCRAGCERCRSRGHLMSSGTCQ
jgi:hypothetical protein